MRYHLLPFCLFLLLLSHLAAGESRPRMNQATERHMVKVLQEEPVHEKMQAAMALGRAGRNSPDVIAAIKPLLKHAYPPARCAAVYALGETGKQEIAIDLLPLLKDKETTVRTTACLALKALGADETAGKLPLADPDPAVRKAALLAAAVIGHPIVDKLAARFSEEKDPYLRACLLEGLTALKDRKGLRAVKEALEEQEVAVLAAALRWVNRCGAPDDTALTGPVTRALSHSASLVRREAGVALLRIQPTPGEGKVIALAKDPDPTVRQAFCDAAGELGGVTSQPALTVLLADPARTIRRAASMACLMQHKRKVLPREDILSIARNAVEHAKPETQREGLFLYGSLKSSAGFPDILKLVKDPKEQIPMASLLMWTIGQSDYKDGGPLAMTYADTESPVPLRIHGTRALGMIRHQPAGAFLGELVARVVVVMGEPIFVYTGRERENAIWAIGEIGTPAGLNALTKVITMTRPPDSTKNRKVMAAILHRYNHQTKKVAAALRKQAYKNKDPQLADLVETLGEERPDIPYPKRRLRSDDFFLRGKDKR